VWYNYKKKLIIYVLKVYIYKEEQFIVIKISGLVTKKKSNFKKTDWFSVRKKKTTGHTIALFHGRY
jgi:hypothetical protein